MSREGAQRAIPDCDANHVLTAAFKTHRQQLVNLAMRRGFPPETAEDISQETFLRFHRAKERPNPDSMRAYLTRITLNIMAEHGRAEKRSRLQKLPAGVSSHDFDYCMMPCEDLERRCLGALALALCGTGRPQRRCQEFELCFRDGLSIVSIARMMGANDKTTRARIFRHLEPQKTRISKSLERDCIALMYEEIGERTRQVATQSWSDSSANVG